MMRQITAANAARIQSQRLRHSTMANAAPAPVAFGQTMRFCASAIARTHMNTYTRLPNYVNNLIRLGYKEEDIVNQADNVVDAIVAWGTTDQVVSRIKAHLDAGANHVCVQVLNENLLELPMKEWQELADATKSL